ncbi:MAG: D-glycerate dehydrogenase [Candidatus Abyssubacteria bacterium]
MAGNTRKTVYITRKIPAPAIALLEEHFDVRMNTERRNARRSEIKRALKDAHALLCLLTDPIDDALLASAPNLKIVANMAVGFDNIDLEAAARRGIMVTNTPGVLTETTADLAWALILAVARRLVEADRFTREGRFTGWEPMLFLGGDVHGKTLGIIGFGRIGQAVARRALGFEMRLLYADEEKAPESLERTLKARRVSLEELLRDSDFVTLHVLLNESTRGLIGKRQLGMMKPSAYLINTSRGPVVDERALVEALKKGTIAGAGLDVFEHEPKLARGLINLPNVVLLPHIGSASIETRTKMALMAAENIIAALSGRIPPNLVS